jgi:isocitrate dehydrogenase
MLSIVPLMNGGGLFETGAGGSAPKHVQQFVEENHLRWDSLGEFLALTVSLRHLANSFNNEKAEMLSNALDKAVEQYLEQGKSPSRKVNEPDNRHSHFYLALYWAKTLSEDAGTEEMRTYFKDLYTKLENDQQKIYDQLLEVQGSPVDLGGYYLPVKEKEEQAMKPSSALNEIIS